MAPVLSASEEMELRNSIVDISCAQYISRCVYVMCQMNVPDLLKNGPKSSSELAQLTGTNEPFLLRVLRVSTASAGIFRQEAKTFELTPKGWLLTTDHPHSLRGFVLKSGHEVFNKTLEDLQTSVTRGQVGLEVVYNQPLYIPFFEQLGIGALFAESMRGYCSMHLEPTAKALDIRPGEHSVVDIAGGTGTFLSAVLRAHPSIKTGELFEIEPVLERARQPDTPISKLIQEGRAVLTPGDMFVTGSIPTGRDVYMIQHIIIDYFDDLASVLLGNIYQAIKGGSKTGRLLIVDHIPTDKHGYAHTMDIISICKGGTLRTLEELTELLSKNGFTAPQVTQVPGIHDKFILSTTIRED